MVGTAEGEFETEVLTGAGEVIRAVGLLVGFTVCVCFGVAVLRTTVEAPVCPAGTVLCASPSPALGTKVGAWEGTVSGAPSMTPSHAAPGRPKMTIRTNRVKGDGFTDPAAPVRP